MYGVCKLPPVEDSTKSCYIPPKVLDAKISSDIKNLATDKLKALFKKVNARVPRATLTNTGDAIIISSVDGTGELHVGIPIEGNNRLALYLVLNGCEVEVELQMSWTFRSTPCNGLVLCTATSDLHPISADKIVAWAQGE